VACGGGKRNDWFFHELSGIWIILKTCCSFGVFTFFGFLSGKCFIFLWIFFLRHWIFMVMIWMVFWVISMFNEILARAG
jgi:hypothetical protein